MTAPAIARALSGSGQSRSGWFSCDCPICKGEGKLGLRDTDNGLAVNCFKQCRRADILAAIERLGIPAGTLMEAEDPEKAARRRAKEAADRQRRIAEARDFISQCKPWNTTNQIACYIRSREIDSILLTGSILWHGMASHPEGGQRPLMVGVIEHVELGVIGVTRTFIAIDGSQKAAFYKPRLFLGLAAGGAVRLGAPHPRIELVVGEGIESTLSYMQMHDLRGWAALSANGIKRLILPSDARRIVVAADNDVSGVGWRAALAAARRWSFEGRQVRIDMPPISGTDWNDILLSKGLCRAA
jgi:hypothetical protein